LEKRHICLGFCRRIFKKIGIKPLNILKCLLKSSKSIVFIIVLNQEQNNKQSNGGIIMKLKHIFGPVISRRLGKSLGIDLIPFKTCSLDCIYCECGKTNNLTIRRAEYVPTEEVIQELDNYLSTSPDLDYVTFSGSGEPTLHSGIGKIISFLKTNYPDYRIALLTNSTLLSDKDLLEEIKDLDLIIPSLDAVLEKTFSKINRPIASISVEDIINPLINLRDTFQGLIWLEIFIIPGVNDSREEIDKFKEIIKKINPDKIQLNSLDRPGTENWIKKANQSRLEEIARKLGDKVEIVP
jgi:wyosine [tRNA(Phe)-imidazoG37] synthetase (radical SAM superfamily)